MSDRTQKRVFLISSSGGHWIQLRRLESSFDGYKKYYLSTEQAYRQTIEKGQFFPVPEATRWNKARLLWQAAMVLYYLLYINPDVVLTTGASPGFFAIFFAKKLGKKTIWVDSIANADEMSLSGKKAGKYADLWLTQWEHLSREKGPHYYGSVI